MAVQFPHVIKMRLRLNGVCYKSCTYLFCNQQRGVIWKSTQRMKDENTL